jgi:hypothetical protein
LKASAAPVLLALLVGPAGCRPPAAAVAPWGQLDPCGTQGDLDEAALGVTLAFTDTGAPKDLEALAALVAAQGGATVELIEGSAPEREPSAVAAAALGRPVCRRPPAGRIRIEPGADAGGERRARAVSLGEVAGGQLALAARHLAAGEDAEARTAVQAAAAHDPAPLPGTLLAIGDSYGRAGRWAEAQAAFAEATRKFPYAAAGWAGLGWAQREGDRRVASLAASARALALDPGDRDTRALMSTDPFISLRAPLAPPALPAGAPGRWKMTAADNPFTRSEALAYAGCREAFRSSPELRRRLAGRDLPAGRWSPAEESACSLVWLRTYLQNRGQAREGDAGLDDLIEVAREGLLDERALHDVAGHGDPRVLWLLSQPRRERLFQFVERHRVMPRQDMGVLSPF